MLQEQNDQLTKERDRLIQALSQSNDRSFITRFLYKKQKQGTSILTLRHAGDIQILPQEQVELTLEQLLDERDKKLQDLQLIESSCRQTVNQLSQDNKLLINENEELKEECDRLEAAYTDIITQFTKMSNIQDEILKMTTNERPDPFNETVNAAMLTDRELKRAENGLQQQIFKIKEEKQKRNRVRKYSDSQSRNSSDVKSRILSKINSVSASNQKQEQSTDSILYVSQKSNAPNQVQEGPQPEFEGQKIQIQKFMISSQTQNADLFEGRQFASQDLNSFNSVDALPNNEGSSGTFGVKYPLTFNQQPIKVPTLNIGGIQIDKSLYAQNEGVDYRSITNRVRESIQKSERLKSSRRSVEEFDQCSDIQLRSYNQNQESNSFQTQLQAVNQMDPLNQNHMHINFIVKSSAENKTQGSLINSKTFNQPINVIQSHDSSSKALEQQVIDNLEQSKVDMFNPYAVGQISHQQMLSNELDNEIAPEQQQIWFGPTNAIGPQFQMWNQPQFDIIKEEVQKENNPSSYDNMSNSIGFDLSTPGLQAGKGKFLGYNCSISGGRVSVYGSAMNSREQSQNIQDINQVEVYYPQRELSDIDVPMVRDISPQKMDPEIKPQFLNTLDKSHGKSAIENSLTSLSIEHQNMNSQTNEDALTHEDLGMNEELFIEFMLEQELSKQIEDEHSKSKFNVKHLMKNQEQRENNAVKNQKPLHNSKSRVLSKDKQIKSSRILKDHQQDKTQNHKAAAKSCSKRNTQLQNYNKNTLVSKRKSTSREQLKPQFQTNQQNLANQKQPNLQRINSDKRLMPQMKVIDSKSIPLSRNISSGTSKQNSIKKQRLTHQRQNSASGLPGSESISRNHFEKNKNPSSVNLTQKQDSTVLQTSTSNSNRILHDINSQSYFSKRSQLLGHPQTSTPVELPPNIFELNTPVLSPGKLDDQKNFLPPPNSIQKSVDVSYDARDNESIKTVVNVEPSESQSNISKNGVSKRRRTVNVSLDLRSDGGDQGETPRGKSGRCNGNNDIKGKQIMIKFYKSYLLSFYRQVNYVEKVKLGDQEFIQFAKAIKRSGVLFCNHSLWIDRDLRRQPL